MIAALGPKLSYLLHPLPLLFTAALSTTKQPRKGTGMRLHLKRMQMTETCAQVICAGVWHNVVLCCLCWLLASALPLSLMPLYSTKIGAVVRYRSC